MTPPRTSVSGTPRRRRVAGERPAVRRPDPRDTTDTTDTTATTDTTEPPTAPAASDEVAPIAPTSSDVGTRQAATSDDVTATTRSSSDVRQEEAAEAEAPAGERPALTQRLRSPYVSAVLAVLLVAVGSLAAWQWVRTERLRRADAVATAQTQAVSAARTAIVPVLSYDYRHLDADFGRALALTAQPFKGQYQQTTAKAVRDLATATKAQVSAEVASAGVVCTGKDRCRDPRNVTVLLFVNQATTSSRLDKPQVDQNRVEVRMTRQGGHWLLAEVRAL